MLPHTLDMEITTTTDLAENLTALLKDRGMTATQLAQALDLPLMTVRRILSGETTDPRISTLKLITDYFGISLDSLLEKNNPMTPVSLVKTKSFGVPILDWDLLPAIASFEDHDFNQCKRWQWVSLHHQDLISQSAFALESKPCMYPRFPQGTIFIIDPKARPADGDIVLIKIKRDTTFTLREFILDPPESYLASLTAASSNTLLYTSKNYEIMGVTLLTLFYNRKK